MRPTWVWSLLILRPSSHACDSLRKPKDAPTKVLPAGADPAERRSAPAKHSEFYKETRPYLAHLVQVVVPTKADPKAKGGRPWRESRRAARESIRLAFLEASRVERLLSRSSPGSLVNRINRAAAKPPTRAVKLPQEVFNLFHQCLKMSRRSGGAFDITEARLQKLWGFNSQTLPKSAPSILKIRQTVALGG